MIALAVTPARASSIANARVSCSTAPLLVAYSVRSGIATAASIDAMLTIRPYPRSFMCGTTARQASHVPVTFTRITCSKSAGETCSIAPTDVDARRVDQHIDAAEFAHDRGDRGVNLTRIRHVAGEAQASAAVVRGNCLAHGVIASRIAGRDGNRRPRLGQRLGNLEPQPSITADHQRRLAVQLELVKNR